MRVRRRVRTPRVPCLASLLLLVAASALPARAEEDPRLTEIVDILHEEGLIDDAEHHELSAKATRKQDVRDWADRISVWADFRARYEAFLYERDVFSRFADANDPSGNSRVQDRHRARYQARINLRGEVGSRASVHFRLISGDANSRVALQTLGSGDDFDTDDIRFDLAYATLSPFPDRELPGIEQGLLAVDLGKVPNPFRSKTHGPDKMLWDGDITLEGGTLRIHGGSESLLFFSHSGVYIIDENAASKDPKLAATQLASSVVLSDRITVGVRGTVYHFFSLDDAFFARAAAGGNLLGGLARRNHSLQVLEAGGFVELDVLDWLPVRLYAAWAHNLSARRSPGSDRESDAYHLGVLAGAKDTFVQLGVAWYHIEANAFPSMFLDSVVTDGRPNRSGFEWTLRRQIVEHVDFLFSAYLSDRIEGGVPFAASVPLSDRFRMRTDLIFDF